MPQIFDVIANENARYKRNELEFDFLCWNYILFNFYAGIIFSLLTRLRRTFYTCESHVFI